MIVDENVSQARSKLTKYRRELPLEDIVAVTHRGERDLAIMRWELYEGLMATLEILSDSDLLEKVREGIRQADDGKLVALEDIVGD